MANVSLNVPDEEVVCIRYCLQCRREAPLYRYLEAQCFFYNSDLLYNGDTGMFSDIAQYITLSSFYRVYM